MKAEEIAVTPGRQLIKAQIWFSSGKRETYNTRKRRMQSLSDSSDTSEILKVFSRVKSSSESNQWISFLPGFPDGSYGWSKVNEHLSDKLANPFLFVEYVGQGDSDKPENYHYSTIERADLVEAQWRDKGIKETSIVTFDYSSLVVLEILSRQYDQIERGERPLTTITSVLMINGGYFADAHSHPIMTTPLLKTRLGKMGVRIAQHSRPAFDMMLKGLWSKAYDVSPQELGEVHNAISRYNGAVFMSNAAGFVDEHKKNAERWDLKRLFEALAPIMDFCIAGSTEDPFEHKQITKARERLGRLGLDIRMFPGGHMTTSEHPDLIADLIIQLMNLN